MRRYVVFFGTCILVALAVVFTYAPWALNLHISDPSAFRATLAIMIPVVLFVLFGCAAWYAFAPRRRFDFDLDDKLDMAEVRACFMYMRDDNVLGKLASASLDQMSRLRTRADVAIDTIAHTFDKGSMTYDRYVAGIDETVDSGNHVLAAIALRAQGIDTDEYARARRLGKSDVLALYEGELDNIDGMLESNEKLISELTRLNVEVCRIESGDASSKSDGVLDELKELVDQTSYYA